MEKEFFFFQHYLVKNKGFGRLGGARIWSFGGRDPRGVDSHLSTRGLGRTVTLETVFFTSDRWNVVKQVGNASSMSLLCPV